MPAPEIEPFRRPDWEPLPYEGCENVGGRVIYFGDRVGLAVLRFGEHGKIHEHAGPNDTIVSCLDGEGFTSVETERAAIRSGERVFWPTLMCEPPLGGGTVVD